MSQPWEQSPIPKSPRQSPSYFEAVSGLAFGKVFVSSYSLCSGSDYSRHDVFIVSRHCALRLRPKAPNVLRTLQMCRSATSEQMRWRGSSLGQLFHLVFQTAGALVQRPTSKYPSSLPSK